MMIEENSGVSIRTLKEQNKYLKSSEYQKVLADLEYLKHRRETKNIRIKEYSRKHNKKRYKLDKEIYKSRCKKIVEELIFDGIDRIPKITIEGKIIYPEN